MSAVLKAKLRRGETVFGQMVLELFTPGIAHDRFRASDAGYFARANDETIVIAPIETARAFDNLDEILATPDSMSPGWGISI
jgi:hypothetical protein